MSNIITTKDLQDIDQAMEGRSTDNSFFDQLRANMNQHGRLKYINKLGLRNVLYGYIREVNCDSILWQDNETPDIFRIKNIVSLEIINI